MSQPRPLSKVSALILLLLLALQPTAALQAQPAPEPADPNQANLTLEERMRLRRAQEEAPPAPATRPATPFGTPAAGRAAGARSGRAAGGFGADMMPARGGQPPIPSAGLGEGPTCALDATIYDVRVPGNQIGRIDVDALTRAAATPEGFEKALVEQLGATTPLYRANQSVRLAGDSITMGTTTPYITSSQTTAQGQVVNTVSYSNTGAMFRIVGKTGAPGSIELDLTMQVSTLTEGTTPITPTVKAPLFRTATLVHKGPVQPGRPFVVVSADAASVDPNGQAVAYIARITLGPPQSTAPAP